MSLSNLLTENVKFWTFSRFLVQFFPLPYVLRGQKLGCCFESTSTVTCSSVIPGLRYYREAQINLIFLYDSSFFSKNTKLNSFVYTSIRMILPVEEYYVESLVVCVLCGNPHVPIILKAAIFIDIDISHYSNCFFSSAPGLSSSIKISFGFFTPSEEDSVEKPLILILATNFW